MPAHRCLFAVIWDDRRRKPHSDEVGRMMLNGFHALAHYVLPVDVYKRQHMPRSSFQKLKIIYIMEYLLKNSDENHAVTTSDTRVKMFLK